jgi:AAA+ ATPase superfamily predicted ATPase
MVQFFIALATIAQKNRVYQRRHDLSEAHMSGDLTFDDYEEVFTPGHPVTLPEFFVGREQEVADLKRGLRRKGEFPVVVGNRGVGKTSLVNLGLRGIAAHVHRINCHEKMTFDELARALLEERGMETDHIETTSEVKKKVDGSLKVFDTGFGTAGEQNTSHRTAGLAKKALKPLQLFALLKKACPEQVIFVLDEYDRIDPRDDSFHSMFADLLKSLADHTSEHNIKFVIVGISDSAAALLGKHRSIERSSREIYLRTLREEDISHFLTEAEEQLQFKFSPVVKRAIVEFSQGYPYYVHLVGVESIDAMVDRLKSSGKSKDTESNRIVTEQDFINSLKKSVKRAFQSNLSKYRSGMKDLSKEEIDIVKVLCLADDRSAYTRDELWLNLRAAVGGTRERFDSLLLDLQQRRQLVRIARLNDTVRFSDPLLAPFLRSWYHKEKLIPFGATLKDTNQKPLFDSDS